MCLTVRFVCLFILFIINIKSCSDLDPPTKMWNFSLEDYQQLSMNTRDIFMEACTVLSKSTKSRRCERGFQVCWLLRLCSVSAAVEEAAALASVSLRPLEGMKSVDGAAPARDGAALAALLKLCNGWQRPGAGLQGQCILVSPKKFEVDVGYNVDVIAAFKQMPTKTYGKREMMQVFFFRPVAFHGFWDSVCICCRYENKEVELFA